MSQPAKFKARGRFSQAYGETVADVVELLKIGGEKRRAVTVCARVDHEGGTYSYPASAAVSAAEIKAVW